MKLTQDIAHSTCDRAGGAGLATPTAVQNCSLQGLCLPQQGLCLPRWVCVCPAGSVSALLLLCLPQQGLCLSQQGLCLPCWVCVGPAASVSAPLGLCLPRWVCVCLVAHAFGSVFHTEPLSFPLGTRMLALVYCMHFEL